MNKKISERLIIISRRLQKPKSRQKYREKEICDSIGAEHYGGPGEYDCLLGNRPVEIKDYKRPLYPSDVKKIANDPKYKNKKSKLIICAPGGFTQSAKEEAERLKILLSKCKKPSK